MKILIMGASCAGSTTLGRHLSRLLGWPCFDSDEYFWLPSNIPYTQRREPAERIGMLRADVERSDNCIVTGSLVSWGDYWLSAFDLVVFLYLPPEIRLQRLIDREIARYGNAIYDDPVRNTLFENFITWARGYDDNTTNGRTLKVHQDWLKRLNCPVIEITGDTSVQERMEIVLKSAGLFAD